MVGSTNRATRVVRYPGDINRSGSVFDDERPELYRYELHRRWKPEGPLAAWLMMNPSWASDDADDDTIYRCIAFSMQFGCASMVVVNLWPRITPLSKLHFDEVDSIPSEKIERNRAHVRTVGASACYRIAAFGVEAGRKHGAHARAMVAAFGQPVYALGTSAGWPKHPMARGKGWIAYGTDLRPWVPRGDHSR